MKGFRFRLATVLRVRRLQEDQARGNLARAHLAARETAAHVEECVRVYEATPRPSGTQTHAEFERSLFDLDLAAAAIGTARARHREALTVVDERRAEWMEAQQRVAMLERLEARQREEYVDAMTRLEERLVEDLVSTRFAGARAASPEGISA